MTKAERKKKFQTARVRNRKLWCKRIKDARQAKRQAMLVRAFHGPHQKSIMKLGDTIADFIRERMGMESRTRRVLPEIPA